MSLIFLGVVFLVIIVLLALRRPLYQAILGEVIRRTTPVALIFCVLMIGYYNLLLVFGF